MTANNQAWKRPALLPPNRWAHWCDRETWQVCEFVALLLGHDPEDRAYDKISPTWLHPGWRREVLTEDEWLTAELVIGSPYAGSYPPQSWVSWIAGKTSVRMPDGMRHEAQLRGWIPAASSPPDTSAREETSGASPAPGHVTLRDLIAHVVNTLPRDDAFGRLHDLEDLLVGGVLGVYRHGADRPVRLQLRDRRDLQVVTVGLGKGAPASKILDRLDPGNALHFPDGVGGLLLDRDVQDFIVSDAWGPWVEEMQLDPADPIDKVAMLRGVRVDEVLDEIDAMPPTPREERALADWNERVARLRALGVTEDCITDPLAREIQSLVFLAYPGRPDAVREVYARAREAAERRKIKQTLGAAIDGLIPPPDQISNREPWVDFVRAERDTNRGRDNRADSEIEGLTIEAALIELDQEIANASKRRRSPLRVGHSLQLRQAVAAARLRALHAAGVDDGLTSRWVGAFKAHTPRGWFAQIEEGTSLAVFLDDRGNKIRMNDCNALNRYVDAVAKKIRKSSSR